MKTYLALLASVPFLSGCASVRYHGLEYNPRAGFTPQFEAAERPATLEQMKRFWQQQLLGYIFTFKPFPESPYPDERVTLDLEILKKQAGREVPASEAKITLKAHSAPSLAEIALTQTSSNYEEISPGVYRSWMSFSKGGDWEVDFIVLTDDQTLVIHFPFKIKSMEEI
jgi:hypothetical protein